MGVLYWLHVFRRLRLAPDSWPWVGVTNVQPRAPPTRWKSQSLEDLQGPGRGSWLLSWGLNLVLHPTAETSSGFQSRKEEEPQARVWQGVREVDRVGCGQ